MLNVIKAELFKYSKRPIMYGIGICTCGIILMTILLCKFVFTSEGMNRESIIVISTYCLSAVLPMMILFTGTFSEEYKDGTIKNLFMSSTSRTKIYLGKFVVQVILAVIIASVSLAVLLLSINMLEPGDGYSFNLIKEFLIKFISAVPIYIGGIALLDLFVIVLKKELWLCVVYYAILWIVPPITQYSSYMGLDNLKKVYPFLISTPLKNMIHTEVCTSQQINWCIIIGCAYTIISLVLGIIIYRKQDS